MKTFIYEKKDSHSWSYYLDCENIHKRGDGKGATLYLCNDAVRFFYVESANAILNIRRYRTDNAINFDKTNKDII